MVPPKARVDHRLPGLPDGRIGVFQADGQVPHELALRRHGDAGAHQALLLQLPDPVRIVDGVPVVAVAVRPVDATRELEGFLRTHRPDLQRNILGYGGCLHGTAVFVFGQMLPDVGVGEMLPQLDPVSASSEVYETDLVEGPVQLLQHRSVLVALQVAVVEGQPPVLYRHDYLPRAAQHVNLQRTFVLRAERVLDDVKAHQFHGTFYVLIIDQTKLACHPLYELDHRRQQTGVCGNGDAGDLFFRRNLHLVQGNCFSKTITGQDHSILAVLDDIHQTDDKRDEPNARSVLDGCLPKIGRCHPLAQVIEDVRTYFRPLCGLHM